MKSNVKSSKEWTTLPGTLQQMQLVMGTTMPSIRMTRSVLAAQQVPLTQVWTVHIRLKYPKPTSAFEETAEFSNKLWNLSRTSLNEVDISFTIVSIFAKFFLYALYFSFCRVTDSWVRPLNWKGVTFNADCSNIGISEMWKLCRVFCSSAAQRLQWGVYGFPSHFHRSDDLKWALCFIGEALWWIRSTRD